MGLGAALQELGQKNESASTAAQKLIIQMFLKPQLYAKAAGMSIQQFSATLAKDPVEALIKVAGVLKQTSQAPADLIAEFQNMEISGARVFGVLGDIAGNADYMRKRLKDAQGAFGDTTSLTDAFNEKNQTLGATLDKIGKAFNSLWSSAAVNNFLKGAAEGVLNFLRFIKELPQWMAENRTAIIATTTIVLMYIAAKTRATQAIILNKIATYLEIAADKLEAVQKYISTAATNAYSFAKGVLTGRISLATIAQWLWNAALAANPLVLVIGLVGGLVAGLSYLSGAYTKVTAAQRVHNELQQKMVDMTSDEEIKAKTLMETLKQKNLSYDAKKDLVAQLIALNPEYLKGLTAENVSTSEGTKIMDGYIAKLKEANRIKAVNALIEEKSKKLEQKKIDLGNSASDIGEGITSSNPLKKAWTYATMATNLGGMQGNQNEVNAIQSELDVLYKQLAENSNKAVEKTAAKIAEDAKKVTARTITTIKDEMKTLNDNYEQISVNDKPALKKNRDDYKKLEDEMESITGKKSGKDSESEYKKLQKEAEKFADDLKKLKLKVLDDQQTTDQKEIQETQQKFDELQEKALKYFKAHITTKKQYHDQEKEIEDLFSKEMGVLYNKQFEKHSEKEYQESLAFSAKYYEDEKKLAAEHYASGLIDKKAYEKKAKSLDVDESKAKVLIAKDYSTSSKKAAEDLTKLTADEQKKITANLVEETDKRIKKTEDEELAKANLQVLITKKGSDARLKAEEDLLKLKFKQETEFMDKTSFMYLNKQAELNEKLKQAEKQNTLDKIANIMQYVNAFESSLNSLNTFLTQRENAQIAEDKKNNALKKTNYQTQLTGKLISKNIFDAKVKADDDAITAEENEVKRKQAERDKAISLFNAIISNAQAVVKTMSETSYPFNIPLAIAQGIAGALQIATIASTPIPSMGDGDWVRTGDKHSDASGGIPTIIERDEAVMNAKTMTDNTQYQVSGTPAQITSSLNGLNGKQWSMGATMKILQPSTGISSKMPMIMAMGGIPYATNTRANIPFTSTVSSNSMGDTTAQALLQQLITSHEEQKQQMQNWQSQLHVRYTPVDTRERRKIDNFYDASQQQSSLK